ncbi:MAG: sigma-70 family RNA polymerase sigma factor [Actinobacteria bacterium]|nr:sigma-70 family RNA polymerase sigma factor [Actinomycetota bacterium]
MGDQEFEHFVQGQYAGVVRTVVLATGREDAEDAVQEAFGRLFVRWSKVSRYERPDLWVRTVALRLARRSRSRRLRERPLSELAGAQSYCSIPDGGLRIAIGTLSKAQRVAIVLRYYEDFSLDEIASVMQCKPSTARVHLHRGRRRLAEIMNLEVDHVG